MASPDKATDKDTDSLRDEVRALVRTHMATAAEVLSGEHVWSATQARLFSVLMTKVLPDAKATAQRDVDALSLSQLREVVEAEEQLAQHH